MSSLSSRLAKSMPQVNATTLVSSHQTVPQVSSPLLTSRRHLFPRVSPSRHVESLKSLCRLISLKLASPGFPLASPSCATIIITFLESLTATFCFLSLSLSLSLSTKSSYQVAPSFVSHSTRLCRHVPLGMSSRVVIPSRTILYRPIFTSRRNTNQHECLLYRGLQNFPMTTSAERQH
jgi:hypothetical protein